MEWKIYCDGSYRNGKSGFGVKIFNSKTPNIAIIAFGSQVAEDSYEGELIAIEKSINIFLEYVMPWCENEEYKIKIYSDCKSAIDILQEGTYKKIYRNLRQIKNIADIKRSSMKLIELIRILDTTKKGSISFKKAQSNEISLKTVDKFARFALNYRHFFKDQIYFCEQSEMKEVLKLLMPLKIIDEIDEDIIKKIIESEKENNVMETINENISFSIPINRILVTEKHHLDCVSVELNGLLGKISEEGKISNPIFVREIPNRSGYYSLVRGASFLFCAKIMGIENIHAILTDLTTEEFMNVYKL
ncbi:hypothetical protein NNC19_10870 [Clostridium sp. SHJSY1]|uniref:hypothetical protein n=1 Tax=Clostridium sp. SHJSY1 TaxID=2942483 RepID=UPI002874726F|nr:hypothetical protein [Clostridium sp. SHJSY1]MDS0526183.1 hypothetical protein [Clostridium sp. SHJSY1]